MDLQHFDDHSLVTDDLGKTIYKGPKHKATEIYIKLSVATRRHYLAIAKALAKTRPDPAAPNKMMVWEEVINELVEVFNSHNPHFNEEHFRLVCES